MISDETPRALLTADQLAEYLQLPLASVWRLARAEIIPSLRCGRLLRFDIAKVLGALEQSQVAGNGSGEEVKQESSEQQEGQSHEQANIYSPQYISRPEHRSTT